MGTLKDDHKDPKPITWPLSAALFLGVSACGNMDDFDIDLRGGQYGRPRLRKRIAAKPVADELGVISYPTYQVIKHWKGHSWQNRRASKYGGGPCTLQRIAGG